VLSQNMPAPPTAKNKAITIIRAILVHCIVTSARCPSKRPPVIGRGAVFFACSMTTQRRSSSRNILAQRAVRAAGRLGAGSLA
jgi:hypothetical protein